MKHINRRMMEIQGWNRLVQNIVIRVCHKFLYGRCVFIAQPHKNVFENICTYLNLWPSSVRVPGP